MPYERLSGQVVKAEIKTEGNMYYDLGVMAPVVERADVAELLISVQDGNLIKLNVPPEDSGAWMGKKVSVVITTKEEQ